MKLNIDKSKPIILFDKNNYFCAISVKYKMYNNHTSCKKFKKYYPLVYMHCVNYKRFNEENICNRCKSTNTTHDTHEEYEDYIIIN